MKILYLLALVSFGATAAATYATGRDLQSTMDAYSRAANIRPLREPGDDELRIWSRDYMGGNVEGIVISKRGAIRCYASSHYADNAITIDRARCRSWHKGQALLAELDDISSLDGKDWNCPVFDGGEIYVEGLSGGKRFIFRVGNPGFCSDPDSKMVSSLLSKAW